MVVCPSDRLRWAGNSIVAEISFILQCVVKQQVYSIVQKSLKLIVIKYSLLKFSCL